MPEWINRTFDKFVDRAVELSIDGLIIAGWAAVVGITLSVFLYTKKTHPILLHGTVGALVGMGIVIIGAIGLHAARTYIKHKSTVLALGKTEKGFLDYKLQAEESMESLTPPLLKITAIIEQVGSSMSAHAGNIGSTKPSQTRLQVQNVQKAARDLDRYSAKMDAECVKLEKASNLVTEGLSGWLGWLAKQQFGKEAATQMATVLQLLVDKTTTTLVNFDHYLVVVEAVRGVTQDMNIAVDAHLRSFNRVRTVTDNIRRSCLQNLQLLNQLPSQSG